MNAIQIFLKPCEGKALIADALVSREDIQTALRQHTVVLIAGTTNAWLVKAISRCLGAPEFEASGFCRGVIRGEGPTVQNKKTPFDFIVRQGEILSEQTIFDVADTLSALRRHHDSQSPRRPRTPDEADSSRRCGKACHPSHP